MPMQVHLKVHPQTPSRPIQRIEVDVRRVGPGGLRLVYRAFGELGQVRLPDRSTAEPGRTDELWKTTCFEAFIQVPGQPGYVEFNFGMARQWASYRFEGERTGMRVADVEPRAIHSRLNPHWLEMEVEIGPGILCGFDQAVSDWRLGLSAVIEDVDGGLSYWALVHPSAKPDFHHLDSFALTLSAPEAP